jgi:hypothetical protein
LGGKIGGPFLAAVVLKGHLDSMKATLHFSMVMDLKYWPTTPHGYYLAMTAK